MRLNRLRLGGGVPVSGLASPVVMRPGARGGRQGGEGPEVAGCGKSLVLHPAGHDGEASAGCPGHRCGTGESLEPLCVGRFRFSIIRRAGIVMEVVGRQERCHCRPEGSADRGEGLGG